MASKIDSWNSVSPVAHEEVLVAPYSHQVFSDLEGPRSQHLRYKKVADMSPLRSVFHKYNMQNECGLALLHRHYSIAKGEILVEKITSACSTTAPMKLVDAPNIVPHLWKFYDGLWCPFEFLDISGDHEKMATAVSFSEKASTNVPFLLELGKILVTMGLQNLFGLQTNHRDIFLRLNPTDTLLETTDVPTKVSSIIRIPIDQKQPEYWTDTFFSFNCNNEKECPHHHACGYTACAYGCCDDTC